MGNINIAGYTYGTDKVAKSPLTANDLELLKKTVLYTDEDDQYRRMAGDVLAGQVSDVLDVWTGFVASHPHLVAYYSDADGQPIKNYQLAVRNRLGQWLLDTCNRDYDQDWLNYQQEIGLRHHRTGKNKTDHVKAAPNISFRYMVTFIYPITATLKPFLSCRGHSAEDVDKMYQAWFKAVVLNVALWSQPYIKDGDF